MKDAELQVPCPNGCPNGGRRGALCCACHNTGWCAPEKAREIVERREKQPIEIKYVRTAYRFMYSPEDDAS